MTVHARPEPAGAPQLPTVHELLVTAQHRQVSLEQLVARLVRELERGSRPADLRGPFRFGATASSAGGPLFTLTDQEDPPSASFGLLNPNPVTVYAGIGGTMARAGQGAIACAPNTVMVLPLSAGDIELGVDPDDPNLTGGNAVVHVMRFAAVQATFAAKLA